MQSRFMSSTGPNIQRLFSQRSFEESLQVLTQLSLAQESPATEQTNPTAGAICWDEVAQDLEDFLLQGLGDQEFVITLSDEAASS